MNVMVSAEDGIQMMETVEIDVEKYFEDSNFPSPYALYIMGVNTTITKKDDGNMVMGVQVYCTETMQEIMTIFYLQQEISGNWVTVASATVTSEDEYHHVKAMSVRNAPSGNYRVKTVNRVRDYNGYAESYTGYSPEMVYYNPNL